MTPRSYARLCLLLVLSLGATPAGAYIGSWSRTQITRGVHYHSMVYDPVRQRLIVFGGVQTSLSTNDVWVLPLNGSTTVWQRLTIPSPRPSTRNAVAMIYDPVRDRLLVHGGTAGGGVISELWQLSLSGPPAWSQISVPGPGPGMRYGHLAAYDPVRDRMVLFGGHTGSARLNDVWALPLASPTAWEAITPTGTPPSVRWGCVGAYDPDADRIVLHGGVDLIIPLADTWSLSLGGTPAWQSLAPAGTPPPARRNHTAAYDPVRKRIVMFGGYNGTNYLNDAWMLNLAGILEWLPITPAGSPPVQRYGTALVLDAPRDRFVLYGGGTDIGDVDDLWQLTPAAGFEWTNLLPIASQPVSRVSHAMAEDPVNRRMWMFGGFNGSVLGDLHYLSLTGSTRWTPVTPAGGPPPARHSHTLTYDPVRQRLLMFGGVATAGGAALADLWALNVTGPPQWTQLTPTGTPPSARGSHTAIYDELHDRLVIYGGRLPAAGGVVNEVWSVSLAGTPAWALLSPTGTPPPARAEHAANYDLLRDRMLVTGGQTTAGLDLDDAWALSLDGGTAWSPLPASANHQISSHSEIYDPTGDRLIRFGGWNGDTNSDSWELPLAVPPLTLAPLDPLGFPPPSRMNHAAVFDALGTRMLIFGGITTGQGDVEVYQLPVAPVTLSTPLSRPGPGVRLAEAYPDPASSDVSIRFTLPSAAHATLHIYDVSGRRVATLAEGLHAAGPHTLRWDRRATSGAKVRPGLYFYEVSALGARIAKRVVLIE